MILDPYFYRTPISEPIAGSKRTVVGFYTENSDLSVAPLPAGNLPKNSLTETRAAALAHARTLLRQLDARLIRDEHNVVTAIHFESTDPALSSILLLPELYTAFSQYLGHEYLGCVPTRFAVFLFPRIGENLEQFASDIESFYHNSAWPVSTELFEWSGDHLIVESDFEQSGGVGLDRGVNSSSAPASELLDQEQRGRQAMNLSNPSAKKYCTRNLVPVGYRSF